MNINATNNDGETAFHMAIRLQLMDCIHIILSKEPNINLAAPKHTLRHIHNHPEVICNVSNCILSSQWSEAISLKEYSWKHKYHKYAV